jgi:hypothetical protein
LLGRGSKAITRDALLEHIGLVTRIGRGMVERLVRPEATVLRMVSGDGVRYYLVINPNPSMGDLASHPRTRVLYEQHLGSPPANPSGNANEVTAS